MPWQVPMQLSNTGFYVLHDWIMPRSLHSLARPEEHVIQGTRLQVYTMALTSHVGPVATERQLPYEENQAQPDVETALSTPPRTEAEAEAEAVQSDRGIHPRILTTDLLA